MTPSEQRDPLGAHSGCKEVAHVLFTQVTAAGVHVVPPHRTWGINHVCFNTFTLEEKQPGFLGATAAEITWHIITENNKEIHMK